MKLSIRDLIKILQGELILGNPNAVTLRAVVDSRGVQAGDVFFALKGERVDGHQFAMSAANQGAVAVVVSKMDWLTRSNEFRSAVIQVDDPLYSLRLLTKHLREDFSGLVVGITGSNGKTTTKQMTSNIMRYLGAGLATSGNLNSQIGLPLVISEVEATDKWMVLEMGASEPGNIAYLSDLAKPKIGVITSIGPAHLKTFGSIEKVAQSKWELIESLPEDGIAILPWGNPYLEPHIRNCKKKIIYFGEDPSCTVRASGIDNGNHVSFQLLIANETANVHLPVAGRFNANNALAAAAVGYVAGRSIEEIVHGLETFEAPSMRMEIHQHESGSVIINDAYNANPASMLESIHSLLEGYPSEKKVLVLGSMLELGVDSERMHFHLGAEIGRMNLEQVYIYGEEATPIRDGAISAGGSQSKYEMVFQNEQLVEKLASRLGPNTVFLFKGSRGMKLERAVQALLLEQIQMEKM